MAHKSREQVSVTTAEDRAWMKTYNTALGAGASDANAKALAEAVARNVSAASYPSGIPATKAEQLSSK